MLSVIVPALNEVRRLPATLQALRVYLDGAGEEYEEYEGGGAGGSVIGLSSQVRLTMSRS